MAKKTKQAEATEETNTTDQAEATEESRIDIDADADAVKIEYHNNHTGLAVREFSREIHGDDFAAIATQFAENHGGTVIE